jgi:uncharacterized protein with FMN-binding domain
MRRVALAIVSTVTGLVFLLSFKTHSTTTAPPAALGTAGTGGSADSGSSDSGSSDTGSSAAGSAAPGSATTPSSGASSTAASGGSSAAKTVTGDAADTRYGPVQVKITVKSGKITDVTAVDYPQNDPRDQQINSYAVPQLNQEALSAQSSHIDIVSGATYTSDGYVTSLQSALDKAGL